jgi:hypothetical protein
MPQQDIDRGQRITRRCTGVLRGRGGVVEADVQRVGCYQNLDVGVELVVGMGGAVARVGHFRGFHGFEGWRGSGHEPRVVRRWGRERRFGHAC